MYIYIYIERERYRYIYIYIYIVKHPVVKCPYLRTSAMLWKSCAGNYCDPNREYAQSPY